MLRITLSLAAVAGLALLGGTAEASNKYGGSAHTYNHNYGSGHKSYTYNNHGPSYHHYTAPSYHGHSYRPSYQGYSYRVRPSYWQPRCWNPTYNCYCYYCPQTSCYYYYCEPYQCYYPVSYCPTGSYNYPEPGYPE